MSRVTEIQDRKLYSLRVNTLSSGGADSVLEKIRDAGEQATRYTLQVKRSVPAPPAEVFRAQRTREGVGTLFRGYGATAIRAGTRSADRLMPMSGIFSEGGESLDLP
jgi:hypothetical protein